VDRAQIELDVFDYGNFREYLADWFEAAQRLDARVSHRWFAQRLGSANPSVLLNVIQGRRSLPEDRVDAFIEVLGLQGANADYFRALVAFAQAPSRSAADAAFATLAELRTRRRAPGVPGDAFDFMGSWWIPAVYEMVRFPDFVEDPDWIATRTDPPITPEQAARALRLCEDLGFLRRAEGRLVQAQPTLQTTERVGRLSSWPYHRDGLDNAARGLQRLQHDEAFQEESAFVGCSVAVPADRIAEVRRMLFELQHRICGMAEEWGEPDRVVQLTMAMVPVARASVEDE
jgi:uncharacterized protein (TIGR02147 family)